MSLNDVVTRYGRIGLIQAAFALQPS
jgi:hypothetical protein